MVIQWQEVQRQAAMLGQELTDGQAMTWADQINASEAKIAARLTETDPTGKDQHEMGAKLDEGKPRMDMVLGGFARALIEVAKVGTFGARKYADGSWVHVPNGIQRYADAGMRHHMDRARGEIYDSQTKLDHAAHKAWNALAELDLILREREKSE
jgi:hypothetical protein